MPEAVCKVHHALRLGLTHDLSRWSARTVTRHALDSSLHSIKRGESDITASFGIYNNSLHWLNPEAFPHPRNPHVYAIADDLLTLLAMHRVRDVEFVLNVDDYPKAQNMVPTAPPSDGSRGSNTIPAAIFSYTKRENRAGESPDADILIPSGAFRMSLFEAKLVERTIAQWRHDFPWESKHASAFFRGTPYCGIHRFHRCSRYVLPHLAQRTRSPLLDIGLVEYTADHDTELHRPNAPPGTRPLEKVARVHETAYGKHKFLLHMDGHSFSNRLQALLLSNSAVLKQESEYIEYYYRALAPWTHYIPFYVDGAEDILTVLANVSARDDAASAIARRGQAFAHANLHVDARMCYWRRLLDGWADRLAYAPRLADRPAARRYKGRDATCGECRRPPNPTLIGPWAKGHPCAFLRAGRVHHPSAAQTVSACRGGPPPSTSVGRRPASPAGTSVAARARSTTSRARTSSKNAASD